VVASVLCLAPHATASDLRDALRLELFERINEVRLAHGLAPLQKDPVAFRVAQQHCARQIFDGSYGHFATDGLAPYHRYSSAGGNDGLLENTASWSADTPYADDEIRDLAERSLLAMLAEEPPDDGHRRAILDPWATHLGTGVAWRGGEVRIAHEFIRRYVTWQEVPPRDVTAGERRVLNGRPIEGWSVRAVSVHFERTPRNMRPVEASRIENWELPSDRVDYEPKHLDQTSRIVRLTQASGGQPGDLFVRDDRSFTFSIPFERGPGLYTIVVWVRNNGNGSLLVPASNLTIRFSEEPPARATASEITRTKGRRAPSPAP
jgi:hypothetical protein